MKRWLVGLLLLVLAGVLLVIVINVINVINSNRDPVAVLKKFGAKIKRNEQGEVVEVNLDSASISPLRRRLLFESFRFGRRDLNV